MGEDETLGIVEPGGLENPFKQGENSELVKAVLIGAEHAHALRNRVLDDQITSDGNVEIYLNKVVLSGCPKKGEEFDPSESVGPLTDVMENLNDPSGERRGIFNEIDPEKQISEKDLNELHERLYSLDLSAEEEIAILHKLEDFVKSSALISGLLSDDLVRNGQKYIDGIGSVYGNLSNKGRYSEGDRRLVDTVRNLIHGLSLTAQFWQSDTRNRMLNLGDELSFVRTGVFSAMGELEHVYSEYQKSKKGES